MSSQEDESNSPQSATPDRGVEQAAASEEQPITATVTDHMMIDADEDSHVNGEEKTSDSTESENGSGPEESKTPTTPSSRRISAANGFTSPATPATTRNEVADAPLSI